MAEAGACEVAVSGRALKGYKPALLALFTPFMILLIGILLKVRNAKKIELQPYSLLKLEMKKPSV